MLTIRDMTPEDENSVMEMVKEFYQSDAVDHKVDPSVLRETFQNAASENKMIRGLVLEEDAVMAGYAYLTFYFASEIGGINLMIEEIFLKKEYRGKGYGRAFFEWVFREYPDVKRYRLEVTKANEGAAALYRKVGFQFLDYRQMIKDTE